jgi:acetyl-CoA carboxylase carboxyltransferase component
MPRHPSREWHSELEELDFRRAAALQMGGPEAIAKFRAQGRVTARDQIDALVDPGTLRELGSVAGKSRYDEQDRLVEFTPSNHVMGTARINGRNSVVIADDATRCAAGARRVIDQRIRHPRCCVRGARSLRARNRQNVTLAGAGTRFSHRV